MVKPLDEKLAKQLFTYLVFGAIKNHFSIFPCGALYYHKTLSTPIRRIMTKGQFDKINRRINPITSLVKSSISRPIIDMVDGNYVCRVVENIAYWFNAGLSVDQKYRVIVGNPRMPKLLPKWFIQHDPEKYSDEELMQKNLALFLIRNLLRVRYGVIRKISLIDIFIFGNLNKDFLIASDPAIKNKSDHNKQLQIEPEDYILFSTIVRHPRRNYPMSFRSHDNNLAAFLPQVKFIMQDSTQLRSILNKTQLELLYPILCLAFGNYLLHVGQIGQEPDKRLEIPDKFKYDPEKIRLCDLLENKKVLSMFRYFCWIIDNLDLGTAIRLRQKLLAENDDKTKKDRQVLLILSSIYDSIFNTAISSVFLF